jgi:hypothetical protein
MENSKQVNSIIFPEIAKEIDAMAEADQNMRKRVKDEPGFWDNSVDKKNTERMKEIVSEIGWPTISKVGGKSSLNAWVIVQHADHDIEFQKYCLSLMGKEVQEEVSQKNIAYLEDRVRVHSGQPQIYGTQFKLIDGKFIPDEIEDPEHVDERRKKMGLTTMAEYTQFMYENYKVKKPDSDK